MAAFSLAFLLAGIGGAQPDIVKPSQLAPVTSIQFVSPPVTPQPPDYLAIEKSNQSRVEAAQKAAALAEAARQAQAAREALAASQAAQDASKIYIYMNESGNRTDAINASSGACGLGQALPCSKLPCSLSDYACQDAWFTQYAIARYGSWANAAAFWQANSWW